MTQALLRTARLLERFVFRAAGSTVKRGYSENVPGSDDMRGIVSEPSSWEELKQKVEENTVEALGTLGSCLLYTSDAADE